MYHHCLVFWLQAIEEGILGMVLQISWPEHEVMKLLELNPQLDHMLVVIFGHLPITLSDRVKLAHQHAVHGSTTVHWFQDLHDSTQRTIPIIHHCLGSVVGMPLQCTQDGVSDEFGGMAFPEVVVNIAPPVIICNCIVRIGVSEYRETQLFSLAVSRAPLLVPVLVCPTLVAHYMAVAVSYCSTPRCLSVVGDIVIPLLFFCLALRIWHCIWLVVALFSALAVAVSHICRVSCQSSLSFLLEEPLCKVAICTVYIPSTSIGCKLIILLVCVVLLSYALEGLVALLVSHHPKIPSGIM